jgi:hypothetical protein
VDRRQDDLVVCAKALTGGTYPDGVTAIARDLAAMFDQLHPAEAVEPKAVLRSNRTPASSEVFEALLRDPQVAVTYVRRLLKRSCCIL